MTKSLRFVATALLPLVFPLASNADALKVGTLYTMSNAAAGNQVLIYDRLADGTLAPAGQAATGGTGTGAGLGNQNALALDPEQFFLFAVNAGSGSVSAFRVVPGGLTLATTVPSGGTHPVSLTVDRGRLFVLNAGDASTPGNIAGFAVGPAGSLAPIADSIQPLSNPAATTGPAQIQFDGDGGHLVVTEKATHSILVYAVDASGKTGAPTVNPSTGMTPFGFAVGKRGQLFVSNAAGGAAGASSLSSYRLAYDGKLMVASPPVATHETAACWVVVTPDGRFAYTTDAASGTVSSFRIAFGGGIKLANNDAGITGPGTTPIDMAVAPDGRLLYTLNSGDESVSSFMVGLDGTLTPQAKYAGLPDGANGLAVR